MLIYPNMIKFNEDMFENINLSTLSMNCPLLEQKSQICHLLIILSCILYFHIFMYIF